MSAPAAWIAHGGAGRVRLRLRETPSPEAMAVLVDAVAAAGGPTLRRVVGRPNTGSVIVETDEPAEALLARLAAAGLLRAVAAPSPPPLRDAAALGLMRADAAVAARSGGVLDARAALALVLLAAAVYQAARGRVFGPAATMLGFAASLLEGRRGR